MTTASGDSQAARPILFVLDGSVSRTGALVAANRAAAALREEVASILVLPRESEAPPEAVSSFENVLRLPIVHIRRSVASLIRYVPALLISTLKLRRAMRAAGCERLQVNDLNMLHGFLLRLTGYRGLLVTCIRLDPARYGLLGRLWVWAALRASDWVIAPSHFIERRLPKADHVRVVYDTFRPTSGVASNAPDAGERRFVFVGNYIDGKGQDVALEAFERIAPRYPEARLSFFGGDMGLPKNREYREALERRAAAGPASGRVEFGGAVRDLGEVYSSAFAAINCSRSESFSLTCQEASAFGVAVIATRSGGPEEIIEDGDTGFLVPVDDAAAVADRMARLLEQPSLAAEMGARGRALVEQRFSVAEFEAEMRAILRLNG